MEIVAQAFGIVGMLFNILVFQQKKQENVLICQFFAAATFVLFVQPAIIAVIPSKEVK
jgi:uncharacterized membrane protein